MIEFQWNGCCVCARNETTICFSKFSFNGFFVAKLAISEYFGWKNTKK